MRLAIRVIPVLLLLAAALPASAAERDEERLWLSVGIFVTDLSTDAEAHVEGDFEGTPIDLEGDLGLRDSLDELRFEGHLRFGRRHRLFFDFVDFSRSARATATEDVEFEDVILEEGSSIESDFDHLTAGLGYRYDVIDRERFELGLSLGVSYLEWELSLRGEGMVDTGSGFEPFEGSRSVAVDAPVPLFGIHFDWSWDERFFVRLSGQYIEADLGDFDGSMYDFSARFDWMFSEHVGVGAGYTRSRIRLEDYETENVNGDARYRYSGLFGYLTLRF